MANNYSQTCFNEWEFWGKPMGKSIRVFKRDFQEDLFLERMERGSKREGTTEGRQRSGRNFLGQKGMAFTLPLLFLLPFRFWTKPPLWRGFLVGGVPGVLWSL